ncbi:MAG: sulfatase [Gemmataceae bacterium]
MRSLPFLAIILALLARGPLQAADATKPNVVIIYADDLGYGDLACYGHPTIKTPNLDRMAAEGMRFTSFYSAASVCTPSRAALMTGRYPVRSGMCSNSRRVLFPDSAGGIPKEEITLGEALKQQGYATACVGKWHLGHLPQYLPTNNGFDYYFGIPYSNDMDRVADRKLGRQIFLDPKIEYWNVPILRNEKEIERPAQQHTLTKRYTEEAIDFIKKHKEGPFFVYLAHSMVHVPLFASKDFQGKSARGLFGDTVEEVDWSVGQILDTLHKEKLAEKTLVVFSSDNGPWLIFDQQGGSAGLLREGKGSTWEGGMREPGIFWWPGTIKPGQVERGIACTMDVWPTCVALAGGKLPTDRIIDGVDLTPVLTGKGPSPRDHLVYYRGTDVYAVRKGSFKAHFITRSSYGGDKPVKHDPPELYNLDVDPAEKFNVAKQHPEIITELVKLVDAHKAKVEPGKDQLAPVIRKGE